LHFTFLNFICRCYGKQEKIQAESAAKADGSAGTRMRKCIQKILKMEKDIISLVSPLDALGNKS
jgi:hypothetical protein